MTLLRAALEPLDPLLFGDNRSARAGESHTAGDQDPSPATLYGALGARIAAACGAPNRRQWSRVEPVLGPHEPRLDRPSPRRAELLGYALTDPEGQCWFPRPLHLRVRQIGGHRFTLPPLAPLDPLEDAGVLSSLAQSWRLTAAQPAVGPEIDEDESDLLVSETLLGEVLTGTLEADRALASDAGERGDLFRSEPRLGVAIDNSSNTVQEGVLFARPYRRFAGSLAGSDRRWRGAGWSAWLRVLDLAGHQPEDWGGTAFLGGDRRRARLRFAVEEAGPWAALRDRVAAAAEESAGFFLLLVTPAIAGEGWPAFDGAPPIAAAVGRPLPWSGWEGWSDRPGPREMRTLYPPGSVFFFRWPERLGGQEARAAWVREHWLAPLDADWRHAGFGRVLPGVWR